MGAAVIGLIQWRGGHNGRVTSTSADELWKQVGWLNERLGAEITRRDQVETELRGEIKELRGLIGIKENAISELNAQISHLRHNALEQEVELAEARDRNETNSRLIEVMQQHIADLERERDALRAQLEADLLVESQLAPKGEVI